MIVVATEIMDGNWHLKCHNLRKNWSISIFHTNLTSEIKLGDLPAQAHNLIIK